MYLLLVGHLPPYGCTDPWCSLLRTGVSSSENPLSLQCPTLLSLLPSTARRLSGEAPS